MNLSKSCSHTQVSFVKDVVSNKDSKESLDPDSVSVLYSRCVKNYFKQTGQSLMECYGEHLRCARRVMSFLWRLI